MTGSVGFRAGVPEPEPWESEEPSKGRFGDNQRRQTARDIETKRNYPVATMRFQPTITIEQFRDTCQAVTGDNKKPFQRRSWKKYLLLGIVCLVVGLARTAWIIDNQFALAQQQAHCSVVGDLELVPFSSKVFHNTRMLRVWLPPEYKNASHYRERYPVLYLNDGQDLYDACTSILFNAEEWGVDETATELIQGRRIRPLIIVGIDNAGKRDRPKEYLPLPDDTLRPPTPKVYGKNYPKFLVDEVMPFINRTYRTDPNPAITGLGGASYGAGIALYTVMKRPGRFGKLLLESPSLYAHDDYLLHEADAFNRWPEKIFVGVGSINEPVDDVHRLQAILRRHDLGNQRLLVVEDMGAGHNDKAWAKRFPRALEFLYGLRNEP